MHSNCFKLPQVQVEGTRERDLFNGTRLARDQQRLLRMRFLYRENLLVVGHLEEAYMIFDICIFLPHPEREWCVLATPKYQAKNTSCLTWIHPIFSPHFGGDRLPSRRALSATSCPGHPTTSPGARRFMFQETINPPGLQGNKAESCLKS